MNSLIVLVALVLAPSQATVPQARAAKASQAAQATLSKTGIFRIAGIIVDANSGAPIPGAQLAISSTGHSAETTADDGGHFSFDALPPGTYMLSATARGYVSASYDQHGRFSTGIVVGSGLDSQHIVFRLPPQGVIFGTVTDSQGERVRRAQVMLFEVEPLSGSPRPIRRANTQTNDLGQYRFAHLNEGRYYVAVQARPWYAEPGFTHPPEQQRGKGSFTDYQKSNPLLDVVYPVTFFPGVADPAAANELHITPGDQEEADVELTPVPSAHVLVTGLPGDPPNGPTAYPNIRADERIFGSSMGLFASIQEREVSPGTWEVDGLPPGQVTLTIANEPGPSLSQRTIATDVSDGGTVDASNASDAPGATVSGRVIWPAVSASGQIRVVLVNARLRESFAAPVRKDGTFSFGPSQPGTYRVALAANAANGGQRLYVESVSATGAQVVGRTIAIPASGNVNLTVKTGFGLGAINGVAKLAGKPAPGVMILLVPSSGQDVAIDSRRDQSNSDGSFRLLNVYPGKYILMAISNAWNLDWTDPVALKPYRDKGEAIAIVSGQNQNVTVTVQPLLK